VVLAIQCPENLVALENLVAPENLAIPLLEDPDYLDYLDCLDYLDYLGDQYNLVYLCHLSLQVHLFLLESRENL